MSENDKAMGTPAAETAAEAADAEEAKATAGAEETAKTKKKKEKKKRTVGQEIVSWIVTILIAVIAALLIRSFIFEPVRVDGSSMDDTLAHGEIMFVSKFDYSTTWLTMPWQDNATKQTMPRITFGGNPQRFDVVICRYPGRGDTNFVKRIVGIPGDTIELIDGYLYVNGEKYDEPYINDEYRKGPLNTFRSYYVPKKGDTVNGKEVKSDMYFVMGDHRNNSNDSRSVGAIERSMIVGHVRRVVYPFSEWRGIPNGADAGEK